METKALISFSPVISIDFTKEDFDTVTHYIKNGYTELRKYAEVGGFWYGYMQYRKYFVESDDMELAPIDLTFREVDLLTKALEPAFYAGNKPIQIRAQAISDFLFRTLKAANEQVKYANENVSESITK